MIDSYLLDTGVANLVALRRPAIERKLLQAGNVWLPVITLGELYKGAYMHNDAKYLDLYDALRLRFAQRLLSSDDNTAQTYGAIAAELRVTGKPIQTHDMWIAALARQYGLTLLTRDGDFARVSRLAVEIW